jgi:hypothetical protein
MNRRHFVMSSAAAAGTLATRGLASPNDTVRLACVGVRGQGRAHIQNYAKMPNVEAACDVDQSVLNQRLQDLGWLGKSAPRSSPITETRKDKSIDAVSATPPTGTPRPSGPAQSAGRLRPCSHVRIARSSRRPRKCNRIVSTE